jgi:hypothetical protein
VLTLRSITNQSDGRLTVTVREWRHGGEAFSLFHTQREFQKLGVADPFPRGFEHAGLIKLNCFIMQKSKGKVLKCFGNILYAP